MQQPASTMRGREGWCNKRTTIDDGATTSWHDKTTIDGTTHDETMRQQEGGASRGDATTSRCNEWMRGRRGAQREDEERQWDNKLVRRVDERVAQREDGERQCDNQLARQDDERAA